MKSPDVTIEVCEALLREFLEGYRGFPPTAAGVRRFAFAVQENCLSVGHARATLQSFEELFPTVRQIHDVAFGLRPQFDTEPDQRAEWEKKYGKPQAFEKHPLDFVAMRWQAFRDMLYYTEGPGAGPVVYRQDRGGRPEDYWYDAIKRAIDPAIGNHADSLDFVRKQAREMGWPAIMELKTSPVPFPYTSPKDGNRRTRGMVAMASAITQADIERAQAARKSTLDVDRDLDSWSDPDR